MNVYKPARPGPYVDTNLTRRVVSQAAPDLGPPSSGSTTLGATTVYDPPGVDHSPPNPPSNLPNAPLAWAPGRSVYANDGMKGQDFFRNRGS